MVNEGEQMKDKDILKMIVVLFILLIGMYADMTYRQLQTSNAQQLVLIQQQTELLERSAKLDVQIEKLQKGQDAIIIPEISPKFLEWWENEEQKSITD